MGMMVKSDFPKSLAADLEVAFKEGRESKSDSAWRQLIMVEPTTSDAKKYVFYGDKGRLRRFHGERKPQSFTEYKATITLDDWEYTENVKRHVLEDDQSGGKLRQKVGNFGHAVETSLAMETQEFLRNGVSIEGFDGQPLLSPFHVYTDSKGNTKGITQGNIHWGGSQLDAVTIQLDQQHFARLQSDTTKVLGMKMTHVGVQKGSDNAVSAREIANSQFTVRANTVKGQNTVNVFQGSFDIIEFDYGIGASEWFSFDLSDPEMKPVIVLSHTVSPGFDNLEYTQLLEDSETGYWRNEFSFGVYGRFDWNPGDWRTVYFHGSSTYSPTLDDLESQRVVYPNND